MNNTGSETTKLNVLLLHNYKNNLTENKHDTKQKDITGIDNL